MALKHPKSLFDVLEYPSCGRALLGNSRRARWLLENAFTWVLTEHVNSIVGQGITDFFDLFGFFFAVHGKERQKEQRRMREACMSVAQPCAAFGTTRRAARGLVGVRLFHKEKRALRVDPSCSGVHTGSKYLAKLNSSG